MLKIENDPETSVKTLFSPTGAIIHTDRGGIEPDQHYIKLNEHCIEKLSID